MSHDRNSHPELSPLLERLTRAVDRYRAVGWDERAEAMQALITLAPSLPPATIGHLEDSLVGLRSRVAHYDDPPRFISLEQRHEFKSSGVPDWVDRLAAAVKARKTELLQSSDGGTRSGAPAEQYRRVD